MPVSDTNICSVCAGDPDTPDCICDNVGTATAEAAGLRERLDHLQSHYNKVEASRRQLSAYATNARLLSMETVDILGTIALHKRDLEGCVRLSPEEVSAVESLYAQLRDREVTAHV